MQYLSSLKSNNLGKSKDLVPEKKFSLKNGNQSSFSQILTQADTKQNMSPLPVKLGLESLSHLIQNLKAQVFVNHQNQLSNVTNFFQSLLSSKETHRQETNQINNQNFCMGAGSQPVSQKITKEYQGNQLPHFLEKHQTNQKGSILRPQPINTLNLEETTIPLAKEQSGLSNRYVPVAGKQLSPNSSLNDRFWEKSNFEKKINSSSSHNSTQFNKSQELYMDQTIINKTEKNTNTIASMQSMIQVDHPNMGSPELALSYLLNEFLPQKLPSPNLFSLPQMEAKNEEALDKNFVKSKPVFGQKIFDSQEAPAKQEKNQKDRNRTQNMKQNISSLLPEFMSLSAILTNLSSAMKLKNTTSKVNLLISKEKNGEVSQNLSKERNYKLSNSLTSKQNHASVQEHKMGAALIYHKDNTNKKENFSSPLESSFIQEKKNTISESGDTNPKHKNSASQLLAENISSSPKTFIAPKELHNEFIKNITPDQQQLSKPTNGLASLFELYNDQTDTVVPNSYYSLSHNSNEPQNEIKRDNHSSNIAERLLQNQKRIDQISNFIPVKNENRPNHKETWEMMNQSTLVKMTAANVLHNLEKGFNTNSSAGRINTNQFVNINLDSVSINNIFYNINVSRKQNQNNLSIQNDNQYNIKLLTKAQSHINLAPPSAIAPNPILENITNLALNTKNGEPNNQKELQEHEIKKFTGMKTVSFLQTASMILEKENQSAILPEKADSFNQEAKLDVSFNHNGSKVTNKIENFSFPSSWDDRSLKGQMEANIVDFHPLPNNDPFTPQIQSLRAENSFDAGLDFLFEQPIASEMKDNVSLNKQELVMNNLESGTPFMIDYTNEQGKKITEHVIIEQDFISKIGEKKISKDLSEPKNNFTLTKETKNIESPTAANSQSNMSYNDAQTFGGFHNLSNSVIQTRDNAFFHQLLNQQILTKVQEIIKNGQSEAKAFLEVITQNVGKVNVQIEQFNSTLKINFQADSKIKESMLKENVPELSTVLHNLGYANIEINIDLNSSSEGNSHLAQNSMGENSSLSIKNQSPTNISTPETKNEKRDFGYNSFEYTA